MQILLTASPQGIAAGLLYGAGKPTDGGRRPRRDPPASAEAVIEAQAWPAADPSRARAGRPAPSTAELAAPAAPLTYLAPTQVGQAPRLRPATPPPGRWIDLFV